MKKISLSITLSFFTLFVNGYAEENTPHSELAVPPSRHSPYISFDISREEAGIGFAISATFLWAISMGPIDF